MVNLRGTIQNEEFNKQVSKAVNIDINRINTRLNTLEIYINHIYERINVLENDLKIRMDNQEFKFKSGKNQK